MDFNNIDDLQREYGVWQALAQKYHGIASKKEDYDDIVKLLELMREQALRLGFKLN